MTCEGNKWVLRCSGRCLANMSYRIQPLSCSNTGTLKVFQEGIRLEFRLKSTQGIALSRSPSVAHWVELRDLCGGAFTKGTQKVYPLTYT